MRLNADGVRNALLGVLIAVVGVGFAMLLQQEPVAGLVMRAVAPYAGNAADGMTTTVNSMLVGGKTISGGAQSMLTDVDGRPIVQAYGTTSVTLGSEEVVLGTGDNYVGRVNITESVTIVVTDSDGNLNVRQATHDSLNANANAQQGNADVAIGNPLYVTPTQDLSVQARGYNGSSWRDVRVDKATDSWQVIDYAHHEIHSGSSYAAHAWDLDWDKADILNVCFTTPAGTKWAHIVPMVDATTATTFTIYEGATADPGSGSSYLARNRNRNAVGLVTSTVTSLAGEAGYVTLGATVTTTGVLLHVEALGEGKKGGMGAGTRDTGEYVLAAATLYCFHLESGQAADDGLATMELSWYEHTDKVAPGW